MRNERINFRGAQGDELSARLSLPPDGEVRACALFAHCFTCSKDLKPVVNLSRALTQQRIAVLRFDFTGLGESEGDFADTSFSSNIEDLVAAAEFMRGRYETPALLIGHSLGGAAVLQAAARIPSTRAVATIGAPYDPVHVKNLFVDALDDIEERGSAEVSLAGRRFTLSREFVRDLEGRKVEETLRSLRRPLLLFHSPIDQIVGIENAALVYRAARHPKSFVSLDDADHLLLRERDSLYVGSVLAAWADRYLDPLPEPASVEALRADNRVTARTAAGAFRTEILARGHSLLADEPKAVGGENLGPTEDEERTRLLEIADRCPVHRTLSAGVRIE